MIPKAIRLLISELEKLPGVGPRSAERLALHLFWFGKENTQMLANSLLSLHSEVIICPQCGGLSEKTGCEICNDLTRRRDSICVVEKPLDILSIDKSGAFKGLYHVLGGRLSPVNGVGPEDLRLAELFARVEKESVKELLLALGMDVESDATVYFIAKHFQNSDVKISRLAQGIPVGASLDITDGLTLERAIENRLPVNGV